MVWTKRAYVSELRVLDNVTAVLTGRLRHFAHVVCPDYKTVETDGEYAARRRREMRREAQATGSGNGAPSSGQFAATNTAGKKIAKFSLETFKFHSLADYVPHIRRFGTTDSYSTSIVSVFLRYC